MPGMVFGNFRYRNPATQPYTASSKAIATAPGTITGMPNSTERSSGAIKPTARPQGQPHRKPHSSTGMCIGHKAEPICGIWPVRKGSTRARARQMAA